MVSPWTWDQTHDGERHFCFLHVLGFAPVNRSTTHFPLRQSMTISIPISQTHCSWVSTSHLRLLMAHLSQKSCDTPGLALPMNVLFWWRYNFPISFSDRDMSRNVYIRLLGSSMVGIGNMRPLPPNVTWHSGGWPYKVTPSIYQTLHQIWLFALLRGVSIEHF